MLNPVADPTDLEELAEIIEEVLDSIAAMLDGGGPEAVPPTTWPDQAFEAAVAIVGPNPGELRVWTDSGTAVAMTARLTGRSVDELDLADGLDSIAELANLFAGTAKSVLPEENGLAEPIATQIDATAVPAPTEGAVEVDHHLGRYVVRLSIES